MGACAGVKGATLEGAEEKSDRMVCISREDANLLVVSERDTAAINIGDYRNHTSWRRRDDHQRHRKTGNLLLSRKWLTKTIDDYQQIASV